MGWFRKTRYVITTLMLGVEGRLRPLLPALADATRQIEESEGDFGVASEQLSRIAGALLEHERALTHVANWGDVFDEEAEAASRGDEAFAENAGRYLSSGLETDNSEGERSLHAARARTIEAKARLEGSHIVVMLTVGYPGEVPELERTIQTRSEVAAALDAIRALQHKAGLRLAHLHYAPSHADEVLTDTQLSVSYPELLPLSGA